jgi:hypothetical protein
MILFVTPYLCGILDNKPFALRVAGAEILWSLLSIYSYALT